MRLNYWLSVLASNRQRPQARRRSKVLAKPPWEAEVLESRALLSAASIASFGLVEDTGTAGDGITSNPDIQGTVSDDGPLDWVMVEFDCNSDGQSDSSFYADASGQFTLDMVGFAVVGSNTFSVRATDGQVDGNGNHIYSAWVSITFTFEPPVNEPAEVASMELVEDTEIPDDYVTANPLVVGMVCNPDGDLSQIAGLEIDYGNDGVGDSAVMIDASGNFEIDASQYFLFGPVSFSVRAVEYDEPTADYVFGNWYTFSFTYEALADNQPPVVNSLYLVQDTDIVGDNITTNPSITGNVWNDSGSQFLYVEFDVNNDGISDTMLPADGNGDFTFDPSGMVSYGQVTIGVRGQEYDGSTGQYIYGMYNYITFVWMEDPVIPPQPGGPMVNLIDDTGTDGDFITTDPRIEGYVPVTQNYFIIEMDINGDGYADNSAYADINTGYFYIDPTGQLDYGTYTLRFRTIEFVPGTYGVYSDWSDFTFTYVNTDV